MIPPLKLRIAVPTEHDALEGLQRRASLAWEDDRADLLAHPDALGLPLEQVTAGRVTVAESGRRLLGFAVVLRRDDGDAELDGLFVEPSVWRRGVGRALVACAERLASTEGAATLWVTANARALGFYEACGFVKVGEITTRFRPAPLLKKSLGER